MKTTSIALLLGVAAFAAAGQPGPYDPQPDVPQLLDIAWSAGKPLPQGEQDNVVAEVDGWMVSVAGFCGGYDNDWKPGKYPRGFLDKVWGLDLAHEDAGWIDLPHLPGAPRQAMSGVSIGNKLFVWGGFSYSEPYSYKDGHCLSHRDSAWSWDKLPDLPSLTAWSAMCVVDRTIYALGGADYDAKRFYTATDRTGNEKRLGSRLLSFDTQHPESGWQGRTPCPGTPRCLTAAAVVGGSIYYIGGVAVADSGEYCNVVDNWRYTPAADSWERLRDLPMSGSGESSNRIVYKDRYVLLPCGYQYSQVMKPDRSLVPLYGTPSKVTRTWKPHPKLKDTTYFNHCYVYDTQTGLFGTATPLPFDDVASITVIRGDIAYMFPGETGGFVWEGEYFGHHPEFVLKGRISEHTPGSR